MHMFLVSLVIFFVTKGFEEGYVVKFCRLGIIFKEKTRKGQEECYTKILSPSCDKTFDIPTCPESQLLE